MIDPKIMPVSPEKLEELTRRIFTLEAEREAVNIVLDECAKVLGHPICLAELPDELAKVK